MTDTTSSPPNTMEPDLTDESPTPAADDAADQGATPDATHAPNPLFATHYAIPRTPEASPDGAWLAWFLEDADGSVRLWLSPTDGGAPQAVDLPFEPVVERDPDSGRYLRGPQWSPDGQVIALTGTVEGEDRTAIWLVPSPVASTAEPVVVAAVVDAGDDAPPEGEPAEPVAGAPAGDAAEPPDIDAAADAPDAASEDDVIPTVATAEPSGDTAGEEIPAGVEPVPAPFPAEETRVPRLLTWGPGSERSPRWSPDGNLIAFVTTRDRRDAIALATTMGDEPTIAELLTWGAQDDREPVWSRDGRFLAFARQRSDGPEHADVVVYAPESGELTNLTEAKASAVRHSLERVPGRNLVAYVTRESDWLSISVINADNKAGWAVTRESGDKTEPRFHPTEARLVYVRTEGFATVACERGLHASGAVALDPGEGVVFSPRWLMDKRVAYGFSSPQKPFGFLAQDNLANAERTPLQIPNEVVAVGTSLRQPVPFEFAVGDDEQFSGMYYRTEGTVGPAPAIVYLPDGPLTTRRGEYQAEEQALASTGIAVLTPVLHGATGFGIAVEQDLADFSASELEVSDLAEAGFALAEASEIDAAKLSLVGHGYGGTLALLVAGARPGIYSSVVAIDPITDWPIELGEADAAWRNWVSRQYGMPLTNPDKFAMRTPATYAAVIDVPLILVGTSSAPVHRQAQLELFEAFLDANGVAYEHIDATEDTLAATLEQVSRKLAGMYRTGHDSLEIVEDIRPDALG